jgi:glutaredoxin
MCTYCTAVKNYLNQQGLPFTEIDVASNANAAKVMVERSGQQGVPQILIDGQLVIGYNKQRIDILLEN